MNREEIWETMQHIATQEQMIKELNDYIRTLEERIVGLLGEEE